MPRHALLGVLTCLGCIAALSGCHQMPPPGPTPLRSDGQMVAFLVGGAFHGVGAERSDHVWKFREDGSFTAAFGAEQWTGQWRADRQRLLLSEQTRALGGVEAAAPDRELPLLWLDGKINLEIDGIRYRRHASPVR